LGSQARTDSSYLNLLHRYVIFADLLILFSVVGVTWFTSHSFILFIDNIFIVRLSVGLGALVLGCMRSPSARKALAVAVALRADRMARVGPVFGHLFLINLTKRREMV
jgi:hypothetical protein